MPLTLSGRSVTAENGVAPSIVDIAVGLSRQPRFAGQTRRWWSVLDHTLFGDDLVKQETYHDARLARLAWLLHDAHEALTGDVPTPFKNPSLRLTQYALDQSIYDAYFPGGLLGGEMYAPFVKKIDRRCLAAEALNVGPPSAGKHADSFGVTPETIAQFDEDSAVLNRLVWRCALGVPPSANNVPAEDHPTVRDFLSRFMELR